MTVQKKLKKAIRARARKTGESYTAARRQVLLARQKQRAGALVRSRRRSLWLEGADPELRRTLEAAFDGPKAQTLRLKSKGYSRIRYKWGPSTVEIGIQPKPSGDGATIVASNTNLPRQDLVERRRAQWRSALESLRAYLSR